MRAASLHDPTAPDTGRQVTSDASARVVSTVDDLAAVLAAVPPSTPLRIDHVLRGTVGLRQVEHPPMIVAELLVGLC